MVTVRSAFRLFYRPNLSYIMSVRPASSGPSNKEKSSVSVAGINIKYIRSGDGDHAVICLPGALGSSLTDFKPQIEGFDKKEFTLIAWDPPGYGHSRPPNRDFSPGFLKKDAEYAVGLMEALKFPKFSVLGWSDGGITAICLAANHPENIRKMAIWGANAYITPEESKMYLKIRDVSTWSEGMRAPMVELYGMDNFRAMWEQWVDEFIRMYKEDSGNVCKEEIKKVKCPLLVLHGRLDAVVASEHPDYIVKAVPGSKLHMFESGKHNIHLRYPEEFNAIVEKFLKS